MSGIREFKANLREEHCPKFTITHHQNGATIRYDGFIFIEIARLPGPPEGFYERAVDHFFASLSGVRTALWDEQSIYGSIVKPSREQMTAVKDEWNQAVPCDSYHSVMLNGACQNCGHLKEMHNA